MWALAQAQGMSPRPLPLPLVPRLSTRPPLLDGPWDSSVPLQFYSSEMARAPPPRACFWFTLFTIGQMFFAQNFGNAYAV